MDTYIHTHTHTYTYTPIYIHYTFHGLQGFHTEYSDITVPLFYTSGSRIISLFRTLEIHEQIEGTVYLSIFLLLLFIHKTCESTW